MNSRKWCLTAPKKGEHMKKTNEKSTKETIRRRQRPMQYFIGAVLCIVVVGVAWLCSQYRIRKAIEAANAGSGTYRTEEEIAAANAQLSAAGLEADENGQLGLKGVDIDMQAMTDMLASQEAAQSSQSLVDIRCTKDADGNVTYTVNGDATERPHLFNLDEFSYNGVHYKRNNAVRAWLILGVDNKGSLQIDRDISEIGLSDGIFLVAENTANNSIHILQVPRDTMTEVTVTDDNSNPIGTEINHLTRAWMYGDNHAKSGTYAMKAVSGLFGGLHIDGYMAGSIDIINELNDYVGGVEVTIQQDYLAAADPAFVQGQTVKLSGSQAEKFVRYRDTKVDFTAMTRMERQRQYAIAFEKAIIAMQKKDSNAIAGMFDLIEDNIETNMDRTNYLKIAVDAAMKDKPLSDDDFSTFTGENKVNSEEQLDEFWPDYADVDQRTLQYFFREV